MAVPVLVISGLPGAGKTSVGQALSEHLGLPLLSLDSVKEGIVDHVGVPDRLAVRSAAREVVARIVESCPRGCLVDIWVNPLHDTNEVPDRLARIDDVRFLEVVCRVSGELAVQRYAQRHRHPAHVPADEDSFARIREAAPHVGPIGLGPAYDLDTAADTDLPGLLAWLAVHGVHPLPTV